MTRIVDLWKDAVLDVGLGRSYGHTGDDTQDCVRLIHAALVAMYPLVDRLVHVEVRRAILLDGYPLGSTANVDALVLEGVARRVDTPPPGSVCVIQEWRDTPAGPRGHCYSHLEPESVSPASGKIIHATNGSTDWYAPHDLWARLAQRRYAMAALIHPYDARP